MVETLLFTDARFVQASLQALVLFDPKLPLLQARMKQLRGEIGEAIPELVSMRKAEKATLADKKTPIPKEVQQALDIYATYYLGLANLDRNNLENAEDFFLATLAMLPEPGPGLPYYHMYRWGAQANLARLYEARGDVARAADYYSQPDPTSQHHGNLLRARDLIWREPTAPLPPPLPPALEAHLAVTAHLLRDRRLIWREPTAPRRLPFSRASGTPGRGHGRDEGSERVRPIHLLPGRRWPERPDEGSGPARATSPGGKPIETRTPHPPLRGTFSRGRRRIATAC